VNGFRVGLIGGYARALRLHLERRGPQTMRALHLHFVDGNHRWSGEELGRALDELEDVGMAAAPDANGYVRLIVRSPL
jgi:hypothetical protein